MQYIQRCILGAGFENSPSGDLATDSSHNETHAKHHHRFYFALCSIHVGKKIWNDVRARKMRGAIREMGQEAFSPLAPQIPSMGLKPTALESKNGESLVWKLTSSDTDFQPP